jgi:hypothetical protein
MTRLAKARRVAVTMAAQRLFMEFKARIKADLRISLKGFYRSKASK